MQSNITKKKFLLFLGFCNILFSCQKDQITPVSNEEITQIISDAYIYAYPLITMKITENQATNVIQTTDYGFAPLNQFSHRHIIPDYTFTSIVSPNTDTFYSIAWLDLDKEPVVLHVPDATLYAPEGEPWRYYLIELIDAWTNVFGAPGVRTTGTGAGNFLITGPNWSGTVPADMIEYKSPTTMVWLGGRTMVVNTADIATVVEFQQNIMLMPLSAWPGPYNAPVGEVDNSIDMVTPPVRQVANLSVEMFFQLLCDLLVDNPPASYDDAIVRDMAKIGITPGAKFRLSDFSQSEQDAIETGYANGVTERYNLVNIVDRIVKNGWSYSLDNVGDFRDDYDLRAYVAMVGIGANLPEDGVYPITAYDVESDSLKSRYKYTITFPPGQTPPANGFWSVTMYNSKHFLAQNPINRYAIGSYSPYELNDDNSLTLYIQRDSLGIEKMSNWLPTPQDSASSFILMMRIYWPDQSVLTDQWEIPGVVRVN